MPSRTPKKSSQAKNDRNTVTYSISFPKGGDVLEMLEEERDAYGRAHSGEPQWRTQYIIDSLIMRWRAEGKWPRRKRS